MYELFFFKLVYFQNAIKKVHSKMDNSANIFLKRIGWLKILCRRSRTGCALRKIVRKDEPGLFKRNIETKVRTIDFKPPPCSEEPCMRKSMRKVGRNKNKKAKTQLDDMSLAEMMSNLSNAHRLLFPNIVILPELAIIFPISNATVERLFSFLKLVKTKLRN